jgi:hypothetical protein
MAGGSSEELCRVDQAAKELVGRVVPISAVAVAHATTLTSVSSHPPPATPLSISSAAPTPTAVVATSALVRNMGQLAMVEPAPAMPIAARTGLAATLVAPRSIP